MMLISAYHTLPRGASPSQRPGLARVRLGVRPGGRGGVQQHVLRAHLQRAHRAAARHRLHPAQQQEPAQQANAQTEIVKDPYEVMLDSFDTALGIKKKKE